MERNLKKRKNIYIYIHIVHTCKTELYIRVSLSMYMGLPGGSHGRESAYNAGDPGSDPWRREWLPIPVFFFFFPFFFSIPVFLSEFHGQSSLAGYTPWGHKESDMTKRLTLSLHTHTHTHTHIKPESLCCTSEAI